MEKKLEKVKDDNIYKWYYLEDGIEVNDVFNDLKDYGMAFGTIHIFETHDIGESITPAEIDFDSFIRDYDSIMQNANIDEEFSITTHLRHGNNDYFIGYTPKNNEIFIKTKDNDFELLDIVKKKNSATAPFNQPNVPTINVVVDMVAPQRRIAKIIGGEVDVKA